MSNTPIKMERYGYGDMPSKHEKMQEVHDRNPLVDGDICVSVLVDNSRIATLREGVDGGVGLYSDVQLQCALTGFFGTDDPYVWKNGIKDAEKNCALICQPEVGHKTLLHCKSQDANYAGKPVYYYWTKSDGKAVMNLMATKRFRSVEYTTVYKDYCCDILIELDQDGGIWCGSVRETVYDTNRPADLGFCFCSNGGYWGICIGVPSSSVQGEPINWYLNEEIAFGTESSDRDYFYAVAGQEYIVDDPMLVEVKDENGCFVGCYLSAIASKAEFDIQGWGAPYLYLGNDTFNNHAAIMKYYGTGWEQDDVYNCLIGSAMADQLLPGFYKDGNDRVVFVQTNPYRKAADFRNINGCSRYGYVDFGAGVSINHDMKIVPTEKTGKIDVNPRAVYSDTPFFKDNPPLGVGQGVRFWATIRKVDGAEPGGTIDWTRTLSFKTKQQPVCLNFIGTGLGDLVGYPTWETKRVGNEWETTIRFDAERYYNAGVTRFEIIIFGISDTLKLSDDWVTYEAFPPVGCAKRLLPPVRV